MKHQQIKQLNIENYWNLKKHNMMVFNKNKDLTKKPFSDIIKYSSTNFQWYPLEQEIIKGDDKRFLDPEKDWADLYFKTEDIKRTYPYDYYLLSKSVAIELNEQSQSVLSKIYIDINIKQDTEINIKKDEDKLEYKINKTCFLSKNGIKSEKKFIFSNLNIYLIFSVYIMIQNKVAEWDKEEEKYIVNPELGHIIPSFSMRPVMYFDGLPIKRAKNIISDLTVHDIRPGIAAS